MSNLPFAVQDAPFAGAQYNDDPVPAFVLDERFAEAVAYACRAHALQARKGTQVPYASHLLAVASLVLEHGGDEDQAIAALLHDVIEDCGVQHEAVIAERFGPEVARLVRGCTDADTQPKPEWLPRKKAYIARLDEGDDRLRLVAACDKLHNLRCILWDLRDPEIGPAVFDRFWADAEQTLWYYRSLGEVFERHACPVAPKLVHVLRAVEEALAPA